jgi:lipoprotein-releasing system permease protein
MLARKRQTILILIGISLGTLVFVGITAIQLGLRTYFVERLIENDAHVRISGLEEDVTAESIRERLAIGDERRIKWIVAPGGKRDEARIKYPVGWYERADRDARVAAYSPQMKAQAIFERGGVKRAAAVIGIDVERQLHVTNIGKDMKQGRLESIGRTGNRIVIGTGLAKKLGAVVGDNIRMSMGIGAPAPFRIVGLFEVGLEQLDESLAYAALADVQQVAKVPGRVTDIAVRLHDVDLSREVAEEWSSLNIEKVQSWDQTNANFLKVFKIQDLTRYIITFSILSVAAFGIYNVLSIIISQKRREIAILRALGFSPRQIESLFLWQGLLLGCGGAAIGLCLGYLASRSVEGIQIPSFGQGLTVSYAPWIYLGAFAMAVFSSLIASYLPAHTARKMTPVEIIRAET